jgi:hypothetical protein
MAPELHSAASRRLVENLASKLRRRSVVCRRGDLQLFTLGNI